MPDGCGLSSAGRSGRRRRGGDGRRGSVTTVSTHMQRVYEKLHVTTNTGAVAKALREKLI